MSKKIVIEISPDNSFTGKKELVDALLSFKDLEKKALVSVVISKVKNRRSNDANEYYMGVVVLMIMNALNELGWDCDKDTVHEFLKQKFNSVQKMFPDGTTETVSLPTRTMDSKTFWEYIEKCRMWAAQVLGINIPDPNEDGTIDYKYK